MTEDDLAARLEAVERRLDAAAPEPEDRVDTERVEAMAERLADLEAAVEAIEGYVGEVERVDDELERRADAALAAADDLEERVQALEADRSGEPEASGDPEASDAPGEPEVSGASGVSDASEEPFATDAPDSSVPAPRDGAGNELHDRPPASTPGRDARPNTSAAVANRPREARDARDDGPADSGRHDRAAARADESHSDVESRPAVGACPTCDRPTAGPGNGGAAAPARVGGSSTAHEGSSAPSRGTGPPDGDRVGAAADSPAATAASPDGGDPRGSGPKDAGVAGERDVGDTSDPADRDPTRTPPGARVSGWDGTDAPRSPSSESAARSGGDPEGFEVPDAAAGEAATGEAEPGETLYERLRSLL